MSVGDNKLCFERRSPERPHAPVRLQLSPGVGDVVILVARGEAPSHVVYLRVIVGVLDVPAHGVVPIHLIGFIAPRDF